VNRKIVLLAAWLVASPLAFADFTQDLQNAGVSKYAISLLQQNSHDTPNKLKALTAEDLKNMGMNFNDARAVMGFAEGNAPRVSKKPKDESSAATGKNFTNSIGMEFVLIPAGEFMMGTACPTDHPFTERDEFQEACGDKLAEHPQHKVTDASAAKEAALVPNYGLALQNKLHTALN